MTNQAADNAEGIATRLCACGCGESADARSKYRGNHFRVLSEAKRKLRECRKYATRRNLTFDLTITDVRGMVEQYWPEAESTAIRRIDKTRGFEPDNVYLKPRRRPRWEADASRLRTRLSKFLTHKHEGLTVDDVERAWRRQEGLCQASGIRLEIVGKHRERDALALDRPDPEAPWGPKNLRLLARAVKSIFDKWGEGWMLKVAEGLVERRVRRRKKDR